MPYIFADVSREIVGRLARYALENGGGDIAPILTEAITAHLDAKGAPSWRSRGEYRQPAPADYVDAAAEQMAREISNVQ